MDFDEQMLKVRHMPGQGQALPWHLAQNNEGHISTNLRIASDGILQYNLLNIDGYAARRRISMDMVNRSQSLGSVEFLSGPLLERSFPLNKQIIAIGRSPTNDIVVPDQSVSG